MTKVTFLKVTSRLVMATGLVLGLVLVGLPALTYADVLNRQLEVGVSGSDVSALQAFLAKDTTLYPQGLVTGYFGFLTRAAVSNFQSRNGIPAVGRVGPATLPVLNFQIAGGMNTAGGRAPIITSVGVNTSSNSAVVSWSTDELARGVVYYSTSPLAMYENTNVPTISGMTAVNDNNLHTGQGITLQNLQASTTYYYLVYVTDDVGNVSITWPSTFQTQ